MNRSIYDRICDWRRSPNRKPLVLQGARRVGKTWLLKEFGRREFRRMFYVNFENMKVFSSLF